MARPEPSPTSGVSTGATGLEPALYPRNSASKGALRTVADARVGENARVPAYTVNEDASDSLRRGWARKGSWYHRFGSVPDAPDTDKPAAVATQPNDLNASAGMRCVNHASTPHVDADVTQAEEEEHVPRLHSCARYLTTAVIECVGAVWEFDTETPVRPIDET
jgi:hypothetical protein